MYKPFIAVVGILLSSAGVFAGPTPAPPDAYLYIGWPNDGEVLPAGKPFRVWFGLRNMGGNLDEWTDDFFQPYSDSVCWGQTPVLRMNPRCIEGEKPSIRGGSWASFTINAKPSHRNASVDGGPSYLTGLRCAK